MEELIKVFSCFRKVAKLLGNSCHIKKYINDTIGKKEREREREIGRRNIKQMAKDGFMLFNVSVVATYITSLS